MRSAAATKLPDSTTCRSTLMLVSVSTRTVYAAAWCGPSLPSSVEREVRLRVCAQSAIDGCSVSRQETKR